MTLPGGILRGRLVKKLNELGPYLREDQCSQSQFFFDCLAVCINDKPAPEKREFWGWWLLLDAQDEYYRFKYSFGVFDKAGDWIEKPIKPDASKKEAEKSLLVFYPRLVALLKELNIELRPSEESEHSLLTEMNT